MNAPVRLLDAGDGAVVIEVGSVISPELVARVATLESAIDAARAAGKLPPIVETVPTFRSLTVVYDPLATSRAELDPALLALAGEEAPALQASSRHWRLPVCYGGEFGPDLVEAAEACGMTTEALVAMHAGAEVTVYMLGFMPGYAFMGLLPEAMALPRRKEPRVRVPAGSVATANRLAGIYPWESPGGWQLLGRCPVPLFDLREAEPTLLAPGDRVGFRAVERGEYDAIAAALREGRLTRDAWREAP